MLRLSQLQPYIWWSKVWRAKQFIK